MTDKHLPEDPALVRARKAYNRAHRRVKQYIRESNRSRQVIAEEGDVQDVLSLLADEMATAARRSNLLAVVDLANLINEYAQAEADYAIQEAHDYDRRFGIPDVPFTEDGGSG